MCTSPTEVETWQWCAIGGLAIWTGRGSRIGQLVQREGAVANAAFMQTELLFQRYLSHNKRAVITIF